MLDMLDVAAVLSLRRKLKNQITNVRKQQEKENQTWKQ
jgi:hypothetical protein